MANTKGTKKMEKAVVVEEEKEISFSEEELAELEEIGNKIQKVVDKYKNFVLPTEENVGYINKNLESQLVSLRKRTSRILEQEESKYRRFWR